MNRVPLVPKSVTAQREEQLRQIDRRQGEAGDTRQQARRSAAADRRSGRKLINERDKLRGELLPEPPLAMAVQEGGTPGGLFPKIQDVPLHIRGSYTRLGPVVPRRLPAFFAGASSHRSPAEAAGASWRAGSRRRTTR